MGCELDNMERSLTSGWEGKEGKGRAGHAKVFYVPGWKDY